MYEFGYYVSMVDDTYDSICRMLCDNHGTVYRRVGSKYRDN